MKLSNRETIKESVKKGGLSWSELHHPSRAYERHFEGYVETAKAVPGKKRSKSVRTYVDSIWARELSPQKLLGLRILFAVLWLCALPPFLHSATRLVAANTVWYVTLPQAVSVFSLGWTAVCLCRWCTAPQKMTVRQHRLGVKHLHISSCMAWIALAVTALAYLFCALTASADRSASFMCALLCLLSFVCILAVFLLEHTVSYTEENNPLAVK